MNSIITGTGSYIPDVVIANSSFLNNEFFEADGSTTGKSNHVVIQKFTEITGIKERRYAQENQVASDLGFLAAREAINNGSIRKEEIDYIIVAHNFGDVQYKSNRVNIVPTLASRIKALLEIKNPGLHSLRSSIRLPWLGRGPHSRECFYKGRPCQKVPRNRNRNSFTCDRQP